MINSGLEADNIASLAVTTAKIAANAVTSAKLSHPVLFVKSSDIASATTTDLSTATGNVADITGTTTITAFGTVQAGTVMFLRFTGILTITHNATSLILPTGANITTAAADEAIMVSLGSGNWRCANYQRKDGSALVGSAATQAEMEAASVTTSFATPGRTQYHPGVAKAWCMFDGSTVGTNAPTVGYNVTSVTRNSTGNYTINFTTAFSSGNYASFGMGFDNGGSSFQGLICVSGTPGTTSFVIKAFNAGGSLQDLTRISVVVFGDQ